MRVQTAFIKYKSPESAKLHYSMKHLEDGPDDFNVHDFITPFFYKKRYTIGQLTTMPDEPYGLPIGPVTQPF